MENATVDIGDLSPRQIYSDAGLVAFARVTLYFSVAGTIDETLNEDQGPKLTPAFDSTMTSLALDLLLGTDRPSHINLPDPRALTGLITHTPPDFTIHRCHHEFAERSDIAIAPLSAAIPGYVQACL